ncbi:MAG: hypothetical protein HRT58_19860 [Crocinitomicaceae bacterium]|nr:hypothetical protein [Flavobacteriales bacterium]NQZ37927.1 hypothetical protein [Crocinitomicaceae bacterium]
MKSPMNAELELRSYLDDIKQVLLILKGQVGTITHEGKSWFANIDSDGSFPDIGINRFSRHGYGIYIDWNGLELDFDFIDFEPSREGNIKNTEEVINIQPWKFYSYLKSKGVSVDESYWGTELNNLVDKHILEKISSKYYFKEDLDKLRKG